MKVYCCAEVGINGNGDIGLVLDMIEKCKDCGCDAVKFQKRTIDLVYTPEELAKPRESPFGNTNGDLKRGLEFGKAEYDTINKLCKRLKIDWFASCWDKPSVDFIAAYKPRYWKIASALLTDLDLIKYHQQHLGLEAKEPKVILSTGMSTEREVDTAIGMLEPRQIAWVLQCTSSYPSVLEEQNLAYIPVLADRYGIPVGFSNHLPGIVSCITAPALGATYVEFHVTKDRAMWGSDQAASIEFTGVRQIVKYIRAFEVACGPGYKTVYPSEIPVRDKLRKEQQTKEK